MNLDYCPICNQMTNHGCLKCAKKETKVKILEELENKRIIPKIKLDPFASTYNKVLEDIKIIISNIK